MDQSACGSPVLGRNRVFGLSTGRRLLSLVLTFLSFPLYIFPRSLKPLSTKLPHELPPTAYLDAARGYAAFIVYNSHVIHESWRPESSAIMQFPIAKVWFRGHAMVDIFFIISGYALSYRMLTFIHAREHEKVMSSLASSTFRRYLRLFGPMAIASFVCMVALSTGIAVKGEDPQVLQPTLLGNLQYWVADTARSSNPFAHVKSWWYSGVHSSDYIPQSWTIPIEYRGSMVLFMFLAATSYMRVKARIAITWLCIVMSIWWEALYAGEFLMGMWIAELRIWRASAQQLQDKEALLLPSVSSPLASGSADALPNTSSEPGALRLITNLPSRPSKPAIQQLAFIALFILSLSFITAPFIIGTDSPFPSNVIAYFIPPNYDVGAVIHFPLAFGAFAMMYALDNCPLLQKPFRLGVSQYLGELSFGIYMMHNTVRWIVWEEYLIKWNEAYWGEAAFDFWKLLPPYLVLTLLVFWAAELFRRADVQVLALNRKLQDLCFQKR